MKKINNIIFSLLTLLICVAAYLLIAHFDGALALVRAWLDLSLQTTAILLNILQFILCITAMLLITTAFAKLQYHATFPTAFIRMLHLYFPAYLAVPFFVIRFVCIPALMPYATAPDWLNNPLYHQALWSDCYDWGSTMMVLTLLFWGALLVLNLFGSMKYGYIAVNIAALVSLLPILYTTLDYCLTGVWFDILFIALILLSDIALTIVMVCSRHISTELTLRPFFALAKADEEYEQKKKRQQKQWLNRK